MIGYIEKAVDYFQNSKPKKAQTVPASLFWRSEGIGIHYGDSKLTYMPFNLFIDEENELKFRVSEHPLQDGTNISDHVHQEMQEVTINGMYTNHPMKKNVQSEVKFKDQYGTEDEKPTLSNTALVKFNELKRLAKERKPVRLVCALETYPKMIITSIKYPRDAKSGSSIRFTMTLREIKTVQLTATTGTYNFQPEELKTANDKLIAAKKNAGKRTAEEIEADQMKMTINPEVI